jgi:hypothetical protein
VTEKAKANFCEFFEFREVAGQSLPGAAGSASAEQSARDAFDALFKKNR